MQESSLHAALKNWYASPGGVQEVAIDGFMIDVVLDDLLVEIQTRNFSALKEKIKSLISKHIVRIVHPIAKEKIIIKLPKMENDQIIRRKSPKKGRIEDLFHELVHIGYLVPHPNLQLEVVFTREEEIRRDDGMGSWRRKGISILDRRLVEVVEIRQMVYPEDYISLLPTDMEQPFTNRQLASTLKIRPNLARKITYSMRAMGILALRGKQQNAHLYETQKNLNNG